MGKRTVVFLPGVVLAGERVLKLGDLALETSPLLSGLLWLGHVGNCRRRLGRVVGLEAVVRLIGLVVDRARNVGSLQARG